MLRPPSCTIRCTTTTRGANVVESAEPSTNVVQTEAASKQQQQQRGRERADPAQQAHLSLPSKLTTSTCTALLYDDVQLLHLLSSPSTTNPYQPTIAAVVHRCLVHSSVSLHAMTHAEEMAPTSTSATTSATSSVASSTSSSPKSTSNSPYSLPFSTALYQQTKARVKQLADEEKSSRLTAHQQSIQQLQAEHSRVVAEYEAKLVDERDKRNKERRRDEKDKDKLKQQYQQQLEAATQQRQQRDDKHDQLTKRRQREIEDRTRTATLAQYADEQHATQQQRAALQQRIQQLEDDIRAMAVDRDDERRRWKAEEAKLTVQATAGARLAKEWERKWKAEQSQTEQHIDHIDRLTTTNQQQQHDRQNDELRQREQAAVWTRMEKEWKDDKEALLDRLTRTSRQAEESDSRWKREKEERDTDRRQWEEARARLRVEREEELAVIERRVKEVLEKKERLLSESRDECRQWRERVATMEEEWQRHTRELNGL